MFTPNAARNILALGIGPTEGLPGMACESSQTTGRKQEKDAPRGKKLGPSGPRVVTIRGRLSKPSPRTSSGDERNEFICEHGRSEAAAPRIYSSEYLVERPNDETSLEGNR
jgi:hypothetical protein